jgi:branched-chain amino acid transport system ATP-binding protein
MSSTIPKSSKSIWEMPMLSIEKIDVFYKELQALWEVSLEVNEGELVSLIGPNGAGKTTLLRIISGLLNPVSGDIRFDGVSIIKLPAHKRVERGISQVPETGKIFTGMSVYENLELGAFIGKARKSKEQSLNHVFEIFPRLEERKTQLAGTLSGGERQMLAIGRALMAGPRLLMLDEPSFGLAPILVQQMFEMIRLINKQGITILLVEQNVKAALELAQRAYLLENGRVVEQGSGKELLSFESVRSSYLG